MATKLPVQVGSYIGKKLWGLHQKNEYTRVSNYKEGLCFSCFKNRAVGATLIDICEDCAEKKAYENVLVKVSEKEYGFCPYCKKYKFTIFAINARVCQPCYKKIANAYKYLRHKGVQNVDPFFKHLRRTQGKDWKEIIFRGHSPV